VLASAGLTIYPRGSPCAHNENSCPVAAVWTWSLQGRNSASCAIPSIPTNC
jgi:hypothetical protein